MKTLNKYMVNRIASILNVIEEGSWIKLELLFAYYKMYGAEWDKAEPDMKELEELFQSQVKLGSKTSYFDFTESLKNA